jgi:hypothetical protein
MRKVASQRSLLARQRVWCGLALGAAFIGGCATGVDVTDEELAEICADANNRCTASAGASVGSVGGSIGGGSGGSSNGGTFSNGGAGGTLPSSAGSLGTSGGSSGSGGTGGSVPLAEGECLPTDDIVILYQDRKANETTTNEPSMVLRVQNPEGTPFPLSDLAIRYWFTADGTSNFTGNIDYATVSGIQTSFGQEFGSDYAEITFTGSDSIGPEGIEQLQLRFHANPYADMTQTNDFSHLSGATAEAGTPNRNITPYLRGAQVGGCLPIPP